MTSTGNGKARLLVGLREIADHLHCGRNKLISLLENTNFPARKIAGVWYAHPDNIDLWFKSATASGLRPPGQPVEPDESEEA